MTGPPTRRTEVTGLDKITPSVFVYHHRTSLACSKGEKIDLHHLTAPLHVDDHETDVLSLVQRAAESRLLCRSRLCLVLPNLFFPS